MMRSKSYVNAMLDLQRRVKQLDEENGKLRGLVGKVEGERDGTIGEMNRVRD